MNYLRTIFSFRVNPILLYIISGSLVFWALYSIYAPITLGLDLEDLFTLMGPTIVGLFVFQYFVGSSLFNKAFIPHALVGIGWGLTFPVLFNLSYDKPFYFYEFANDFLFGLILFIVLVLLQYLCIFKGRWIRSISATFSVLDVVLLIIPMAQIGYYYNVKHCLTPASLLALYMTNPRESYEYVINAVGLTGLVGILVSALLLIGIFYTFNKYLSFDLGENTTRPLRIPILVVSIIALLSYSGFLFPKTNIVANWLAVRDYMKQMQTYNTSHVGNFNDLQLTTPMTAAQGAPGTIIMVIGESASRTYMRAFNPKTTYADTPWESEMLHNPNFFFYNHAYSSYVQTVPTLERALTERNQYDDRDFLTSTSLLDVAKKAGYHTYWFSNQGIYGDYDTAISLIAKTADHAEWAHSSYEFSDKYDEAILPLLKKVNPKENNFIVIHLMGSHIYYNDRYPSSFSIFKKTNPPSGLEAYSNSIMYTDYVLQQIFTYGEKNLNLQVMLYFSDHGENLTTSHNPDIFDFDMTRIPLWIYLSDTYKNAYPLTDSTLESRKNSYFTNDLIYDLISGLLQAPSNRYEPKRDFSNPAYNFTKDTLTTLLGQHKLSEDPENNETKGTEANEQR